MVAVEALDLAGMVPPDPEPSTGRPLPIRRCWCRPGALCTSVSLEAAGLEPFNQQGAEGPALNMDWPLPPRLRQPAYCLVTLKVPVTTAEQLNAAYVPEMLAPPPEIVPVSW